MRRRQKAKDVKIAEALVTLIGVIAFLWFFSPTFRLGVEIVLIILLIVGLLILAGLAGWFAYKAFVPRKNMPHFEPRQTLKSSSNLPVSIPKPPTIGDELQQLQKTPEPTLSEQLRKIDWFQFEKLIEIIYRHRGYSVWRMGGANPDGGIDLMVALNGEKSAIQCKHWKKWLVGVAEVREFLGALTDKKISRGIFVTLSGYSGDAKCLADKHNIQILNESDVIAMLEDSGLKYSSEVCELLSSTKKFCPKCEYELVLRTAKNGGHQFWGCSTFPRCRFIMKLEEKPTNLKEVFRMRRESY